MPELTRFAELPDFPDDITYDTTFPQFQPRFRAVGLETLYRDEKAIARRQREYEENLKAYDQMADEMMLKSLESVDFAADDGIEEYPAAEPAPPITAEERRVTRSTAAKARPTTSNVSTIRSRDAATALSGPKTTRATATASHARSASLSKLSRTTTTTTTTTTASSILATRKTRTPTPTLTTTSSSMRHSAALASSKTTVGYSKGRTVRSVLSGDGHAQKEYTAAAAKESAKLALSPHTYLELYGPPPLGSAMWRRCRAAGCFDESSGGGDDDEDQRELGEEVVELPLFEEDEETRDFQLTL